MANRKKPPVKPKKPAPAKPLAQKKHARVDLVELLRFVLIVVLAAASVVGIVLSVNAMRGELLQRKVDTTYSGTLQTECIFPIQFDDEQVRKSLRATKRHGQTHAFSYFCNDTLNLDSSNMTGFIWFGNPKENDCVLVLSVVDETGRLLYRSNGVVPGKNITQIRIYGEVEQGTHSCTAYVAAYTGQDKNYKCVGVQYSHLTVEVGEAS